MTTATQYEVHLHLPYESQRLIIASSAKRKIVRAGRRGGKTCLAAQVSVEALLKGLRPLYAAPTSDQLDSFWFEVCRSLAEPIRAGVYRKNEVDHVIERAGTKTRLRGKTAWNADMLRGDYTDLLILDEWQLMSEDTWELVGAPMLLDNNGDALFLYTPPSLRSRSVSKARNPRHAANMYSMAQEDTTGRWEAFHFTSLDNPHLDPQALADIAGDMTSLSYRLEILAEDVEEILGAMWTRALIAETRTTKYPTLARVVVGVDPPGGATECGIIVAGLGDNGHAYVIDDKSIKASPDSWAEAVLTAFNRNTADRVVGEANFGGDMVENTIIQAAKARGQTVAYKPVHASRGKAVRAEPVAAMYEQGRIHHVGEFPYLEEEMCTWLPGVSRESPNRLDALVWAITELMLEPVTHKPFMIGVAT